MKRKRRMLVQKDITAQEWKVNNGKIEVIPFVVKPIKWLISFLNCSEK